MKEAYSNKDTKNQRESQDPKILIEELEFDPTRRGYTQIPNYFKYYWTPLIGHKAASVYEMILSFSHGDKDACHPSLNRLCAHLGMTRQELTGREHQFRITGRGIQKYRKQGMLEILQDHGLLFIEADGRDIYTRSYTFKILKNSPLLVPEQLSRLPKLLQESHRRLTERHITNRAKLGRLLSESLQDIGKAQDLEIYIEEIESDPTRRGYIQVPNYFKYYWTPLIGHKAASVYEMILSFAHGDKDACHPSLNRLCSHLGMDYRELNGRDHHFRNANGKAQKYQKRGVLNVLHDYGLLFVEAKREGPHTRSYIFRVLKSPPFLTTEQLSRLLKLLQELHQKLVEQCEDDRSKLGHSKAFKRGSSNLPEGGSSNLPEGGVVTYRTNITINKTTIKQQQQNTLPTHHPVVVVSCPQKGAKKAGALPQLPRVIPIQDNIPDSIQSDITPSPLPLTLTSSFFFAAYEKRITSELVPKYGIELVQQYIDWLDFQYRDQPPNKPFTLLAVSLTRGNLIQPEGFQDREELERKRLEKERQQEAARQEKEKKRKESEANQEKLAQAQALFESLPEGEKEVWWQRAIQKLPVFLRSMSSIVENQIHLMILKELKPGGHDFSERTGEETTEQRSASAGDNFTPVSPAP